ncbi:acylphosphatase [Haliangium ochraceum]|uniref:acylphosphatase n=1 Tax=Haliangium ochraceum (strain DSM 14365 / JCM 11303 / SMP-2) TaxID=502025 RepID=D0LRP8_HALO1|nr:acylphosphatase [Haliangium ochraceum]ACY19040.1 acylphosphatase [Haliangium ochraceum DSM 14365]
MAGEADIARMHLRITGRVQGVGYRASTRERARSLELSGWVRNTDDGAVELEAEGAQRALEALLAWCRQGPPGARVIDIERSERVPSGEGNGEFHIER